MLSQGAGLQLPTYSLEQTSRNGSRQFEIARVSELTQLQKELFFVPHRKDFYLFAFVRQGSSRNWVDGTPFVLKPDTLYFSSPQQVFLKEEGTYEAVCICFTLEFLNMEDNSQFSRLPIIQNRLNGHELRLSPDDVAFIEDLSAKMLAEQQHGQNLTNSMLLAYLRVLLIYLSRLYTAQFTSDNKSPDRDLLTRFTSLVSDNFTQCHDVATYAGMLNLSTGHFGELVKKQSGKTPIEHIHDRLLLEAKRLLFHTDVSVKEIAFQLGFEEATYFNRFFKRLTQSTPLGYRSSIREMYH